MTTLTLVDSGDSEKWELPNVQQSDNTTDAQTNEFSFLGAASDEYFINIIGESETFELTGLVTAPKLSGKSSPNSYSSDWLTALAEFAARGEAFAHSAQHEGYTLEENNRDRTNLSVVLEEFQWSLESGAVYQLSFQATFRRGKALLPDETLSIASPTPGNQNNPPTLGGYDLKGFDRLNMTKGFTSIQTFERAFASDAGENDIVADGGVGRTFTYEGVYPGSESTRNTFDDNIRSLIDDTAYTFSTIFPGYDVDVKVVNFNSDRDWRNGGRAHEYSIEMQEART